MEYIKPSNKIRLFAFTRHLAVNYLKKIFKILKLSFSTNI